MKNIQRVIFSGGGTGGHIYPALALIDYMKKQFPNIEVLYIGTSTGLESQIIPKVGIPFETVETQGIRRSLSLSNLKSLGLMVTSTLRARKIIKNFQPDVVIGTGGYVAAPVLLAASQLGIPTLIHEQNSVAGMANKFLARFVDKVALSFPEAKDNFGNFQDKTVYTGNPRGQQVLETPKEPSIFEERFGLKADKPTVLIFGGSRGAPAVTKAALHAASQWMNEDFQIIIATGKDHFEEEKLNHPKLFNPEPTNIRVVPYIDEMPKLFRLVDLIVSRSGATTLAEVTGLGLPSVLIPSPYVTANHQEHNALSLVNNGAAHMIRETELTAANLAEEVTSLMKDPEQLNKMAQAAKDLGMPQSAELLLNEVLKIV